MAWGKPWPTRICTINCGEILLNETDNGEPMDIDRAGDDLDMDIPATENFKYLCHVDLLQEAFDLTPNLGDLKAIIILREYEFLRELLERKSKLLNGGNSLFFLVTGHPGTGSSLLFTFKSPYNFLTSMFVQAKVYPSFIYSSAALRRNFRRRCNFREMNTSSSMLKGCLHVQQLHTMTREDFHVGVGASAMEMGMWRSLASILCDPDF